MSAHYFVDFGEPRTPHCSEEGHLVVWSLMFLVLQQRLRGWASSNNPRAPRPSASSCPTLLGLPSVCGLYEDAQRRSFNKKLLHPGSHETDAAACSLLCVIEALACQVKAFGDQMQRNRSNRWHGGAQADHGWRGRRRVDGQGDH